jgi:hypothetical protein
MFSHRLLLLTSVALSTCRLVDQAIPVESRATEVQSLHTLSTRCGILPTHLQFIRPTPVTTPAPVDGNDTYPQLIPRVNEPQSIAVSTIAFQLKMAPLTERKLDLSLKAPAPGKLPRLIVYQQTHHQNEQPISLMKLVDSGLTHIYISAFHLNGIDNVTLNDHPSDHPRFTVLWGEVEVLRKSGIKILGMLGGAAQGSFQRLSGDNNTVRLAT